MDRLLKTIGDNISALHKLSITECGTFVKVEIVGGQGVTQGTITRSENG